MMFSFAYFQMIKEEKCLFLNISHLKCIVEIKNNIYLFFICKNYNS